MHEGTNVRLNTWANDGYERKQRHNTCKHMHRDMHAAVRTLHQHTDFRCSGHEYDTRRAPPQPSPATVGNPGSGARA